MLLNNLILKQKDTKRLSQQRDAIANDA